MRIVRVRERRRGRKGAVRLEGGDWDGVDGMLRCLDHRTDGAGKGVGPEEVS